MRFSSDFPRSLRSLRSVRLMTVITLVGALLTVINNLPNGAVAAAPGFTVSGGQILDPSGAPFIPVGMHLSGRHGPSPQASVGIANTMKAWGFNTARIVTCLDPQCFGSSGVGYQENSDTDAIVRDLTARKAVAMIESYHIPPGTFPTDAQKVELGNWWESVATKYKDNPFVWFNVINEPGENANYGVGVVDPQWLSWNSYLAGRIRATGATNPIVIDGSNNGQDIQYNTDNGALARQDASAILTYGPQLLASVPNVIFSLHVYDVWGKGTDAQNQARLNDYIARVKAFGGTLIIGEAGFSENGLERTGALINAGVNAAFVVAAQQKTGVINFAIPNSNNPATIPDTQKPYTLTYGTIGDANQINSPTAPTNLSKLGTVVWNYSKAIQAAAPGNLQMTAPPVGTPVLNEAFNAIPGTISPNGGSALSLVAGANGQALGVSGASTPSFNWNANGVLVPGKTYAISVQAKSLSTPDPIHLQFIGGDNSNWAASDATTNGWAWANVNNSSATAWTQTDFVVTIPPGNTGNVNFTSNGNNNFAIDNLVITDVTATTPVLVTTVATTTTTLPPSAVKGFTVAGGQILDPVGTPFIPVGMHLSGRHGPSPQASVGIANTMKTWGFNTARIVTCLDPQCFGSSGSGYFENGDTDAIVRDLTARKAVAMIESYHIPPGTFPTDAQKVEVGNWWEAVATKYKDNPYVWFNIMNEPGENANYGVGAADPQWLSWNSYLATRIRNTGALNPIVVDGSNNGQDIQYNTEGGALGRTDASAILSFGPQLLANFSNIIFSLHVYDVWGKGTDAQNQARLVDYIARVRAMGGTLIIGEAGFSENGLERTGALINAGVNAAFIVAAQQKVGVIAFAIPNSNNPATIPDTQKPYQLTYGTIGDANQIDTANPPSNLSKLGKVVWNYSKAIAAAVPANGQLTDPISGTPVSTEGFAAIPSSMAGYGGSILTLVPGVTGQALAVSGGSPTPSFTWLTNGILTAGKTYAISIQAKSLGTPDPIHMQLIGTNNANWATTPSNLGWAFANINNSSASAWTRTDFVMTVPAGYTGTAGFISNGSSGFAIDNIIITDVSSGFVIDPTTTTTAAVTTTTAAVTTTTAAVTTTTAAVTTTTAAVTTTTAPPAGTGTVIYGDSIAWDNWSWNSTLNPATTNPVKNGANSLAVTFTGAGGAASFRTATPIVPVAGQGITFWAYGAAGGNTIDVLAMRSDIAGATVAKRLQVPAGVWTLLSVPWADLGSPATVARVNIVDAKNAAQPTFYIDDLTLTGTTAPPTTTTVAATTTTVATVTTTAPPSASGTLIYGDTLAWTDWSWNTTRNETVTSPVKVGSNSMSITFTGAFAGASFRTAAPVTPTAGQAIRFWAYGAASGNVVDVRIQTTDINGASVASRVNVPAGVWTQVIVPLADLGSPAKIARVNLTDGKGAAQPAFFIDDLRIS
jgi:mannan endo-1,4-beta-mannosidase